MTCTRCESQTATGVMLCHACTTSLEAILDQIPDALATAADTIARLDNTGTSGSGGSKTSAPVEAVNVSALDHKIDLDEKIHSWARLLLEEDNPDVASVTPLAYLRMSTNLIRTMGWAGELLRELDEALREVHKDIDRPQERFAYGKCGGETLGGSECSATITAVPDAEWAVCRNCGSAHDLNARVLDMKARAKGEPMTAADVRKWLFDKAGIKVKSQDFKNWVYLGLLGYVHERVVSEGKPVRLYFPGDVFKIHHHMQARRGLAA